MKITWLGQAGLMLESNGKIILIDPYLSDNVKYFNPKNYRRQPVDPAFLAVKPDIIICTHDHLDHYDVPTLRHYMDGERSLLFLGPTSCYQKLGEWQSKHNCVKFDRHTRWTQDGVVFSAVAADHSDPHAIGVIIEDDEKRIYITGDTLYNTDVLSDVTGPLDAVFLPVNGVGNNMNMTDAAAFAAATGARVAVPIHWGMFDALDPAAFPCPNKVIPALYREIDIDPR
ncbi:MAG: MBL fold metallo-hydrolase [Crenarchaeota archaeon]|nr:MBL fold metallo-hydrolase [Thermoproteota archaeon]